jgi:hypothetical protein
MKLLQTAAIALAIFAASASSAFARDHYSVGINVDNYGSRTVGYSSDYALGYSNRPRVVYEPTVVYYGSPSRYYEPTVVYREDRSCRHDDNRGYRGHHHHRDYDED